MRTWLLACAFCGLSLWVVPGLAAAAPPDPPHNIEMGSLPGDCYSDVGGTAAACENAVIYYLNKARAEMGLPDYRLPADFLGLPPDRQIFILSNLDRTAYTIPAVVGLNADLSANAAQGVASGDDPELSGWSYGWDGYYSNWAGDFENAPAAYYAWMYDDGPGSGNLACQSPSSSGCWGHRRNILTAGPSGEGFEAAMGAAAGDRTSGQAGYAQLIVTRSPGFMMPPPYYYTWAEALADGAGTYPYDPGVPDVSGAGGNRVSPRLTLTYRHNRLRVRGNSILIGRQVTIVVRREAIPCAPRRSSTRCGWQESGPVRRLHPRLARTTSVRLRPAGAWERIAIHARTAAFKRGSLRVGATVSSLRLRGPRPHPQRQG